MAWFRSTPPLLGMTRVVHGVSSQDPRAIEKGRVTRTPPPTPNARVFRIRTAWRRQEPVEFTPGRVKRVGPRRITHDKVYRQAFRAADDSLDGYELYLGEGQMPDFEDSTQPVDTSPTLPFAYPPPTPSSGQTLDLYLVTLKRDRFDLASFNQYPTILTLNDLAEEEPGPLSVPEIRRVIDTQIGEIAVYCLYPYGVDRNEADAWEVFVEDGVDPDPETDTPVATGTLTRVGADYQWRATVSESWFTPGLVLHIMAVVYRSEDSADSELGESIVTQHTLADTIDLDPLEAEMF